MYRVEKYSTDKTYALPNGGIGTPEEVARQFPAVEFFPHILTIAGDTIMSVESLAAMRIHYGINEAFDEAEAIAAIEVIVNTLPPEAMVSPEERIAAMLEYQTMMLM